MALKLSDLKIDIPKTLEGDILLVEEPRIYEQYKDGIKTGPIGLAYTCIFESLNYDKQVVKVQGSLTPEIQYEGKPIRVYFEELEGKAWQDFGNKGEIKLSITAKSISVVDKKKIKMNTGE